MSKIDLPSNNCPQEVNIRRFESSLGSVLLSFCRSSGCCCVRGCCCRCCFSEIRISFECFDSKQLSGFKSDAHDSFESFELLESWLLTVESSAIVAFSMLLLLSPVRGVLMHHYTHLFLPVSLPCSVPGTFSYLLLSLMSFLFYLTLSFSFFLSSIIFLCALYKIFVFYLIFYISYICLKQSRNSYYISLVSFILIIIYYKLYKS